MIIYSNNVIDCIGVDEVLGEPLNGEWFNPSDVIKVIQYVNEHLREPIAEAMLFDLQCKTCGCFRLDSEEFYKFCANAELFFYDDASNLEEENSDAYYLLEVLLELGWKMVEPLVTDDYETYESAGVTTSNPEWNRGQEFGDPLVLKARSIWFGNINCGACKGLRPHDDKMVTKAKEFTGITLNPKEAGYLLHDGTMLDLSGRHCANGYRKVGDKFVPELDDYLKNNRIVEHTEIAQELVGDDGIDALYSFMLKVRAVRVDFNTGLVNANFVPSDRQLQLIADLAQKCGLTRLNVEYSGVHGKVISQAYVENITLENIRSKFR